MLENVGAAAIRRTWGKDAERGLRNEVGLMGRVVGDLAHGLLVGAGLSNLGMTLQVVVLALRPDVGNV